MASAPLDRVGLAFARQCTLHACVLLFLALFFSLFVCLFFPLLFIHGVVVWPLEYVSMKRHVVTPWPSLRGERERGRERLRERREHGVGAFTLT